MSDALLQITGLSAVSGRADGAAVLRGVHLALQRGEVHGLLGESGAGKTTIAKAVLGILPATIRITTGCIRFEGRELLTLPRAALREIMGNEIALIPQDPQTGLNPGRRIGAQLTDGLRLRRGLSARAAQARAVTLLEEVHIKDPARVLHLYPHQLSGGMRQRVLIASAFALEPKLVVADEPTTALDVTVQKQILRLIRGMQQAHGTAVVFVTHDLGVAAQICDRLTVLFAGQVIEAGATVDIIARPGHPYTQALLAASPRYDRPDAGLHPVPAALLERMRAEAAGSDKAPRHD